MIVWLVPALLPASVQVPVPAESVTVQLPPAPLTDTVPDGVPALPLTVAVTVVVCPTLIVDGDTLTLTEGVALITVSVVVPLLAPYMPSPP